MLFPYLYGFPVRSLRRSPLVVDFESKLERIKHSKNRKIRKNRVFFSRTFDQVHKSIYCIMNKSRILYFQENANNNVLEKKVGEMIS